MPLTPSDLNDPKYKKEKQEMLKEIERQKRDGTYYRSRSSDNSNPPSGDNRPFGQISDGGGGALGTIDRDGTIHDKSGTPVARIDGNDILDGGGGALGYIDNDGSIVSNGSIIGQIDGGDVADGRGNTLGYIDNDGTIHDASGTPIGSVPAGDNKAGALFLLHRDCKMHNRC